MELGFNRNDGGAAEAGYPASARDCVVRSIAIALRLPFREVVDDINTHYGYWTRQSADDISSIRNEVYPLDSDRSPRELGADLDLAKLYLRTHGWNWVEQETPMRPDSVPEGRVIMSLPQHFTAIIDGVINDTFNPVEHGMTMAEGYFVETGDTSLSYRDMVVIYGQGEVDEMVADGDLEVPEDLI